MKKIMSAAVCFICAFIFCGCGGTTNTQASQPSLSGAMQKSADTRQQVQNAKSNYETMKTINNATGATNNAGQAIKNSANQKVSNVKTQVKSEADAWKNTVK